MTDILVGVGIILVSIVLGVFRPDLSEIQGFKRLFKAFLVLCVAIGICFTTRIITFGFDKDPDDLEWREDIEVALKEARDKGKPALLDCSAEWCGACKELERRTLRDPRVVQALKDWVVMRIDMTNFDESQERLQRLGLSANTLPHVFFFMPDGRLNPGVTLRDFEGPSAFLLRIEMALTFHEEKMSLVQKWIEEHGLLLAFLLVFLAGLGTSFTPCVYPMIPITMSVVGGQRSENSSLKERAVRSATFVLGLVTMYTALGIIAASMGIGFGSWLQHRIVTLGIAVLFMFLALSYLGFFTLDVPQFIKKRLTSKKGGFLGVFTIGCATGVVAAPCAGPVVVAILAMIGTTGNIILGSSLMFAFALGMGFLFFILGLSTNLLSRLPKGGPWMERIEIIFAIILMVVSVYYGRLSIGL